jgi:hypothetical protein
VIFVVDVGEMRKIMANLINEDIFQKKSNKN